MRAAFFTDKGRFSLDKGRFSCKKGHFFVDKRREIGHFRAEKNRCLRKRLRISGFAKIGENALFRSDVWFVFVCAILVNREGALCC